MITTTTYLQFLALRLTKRHRWPMCGVALSPVSNTNPTKQGIASFINPWPTLMSSRASQNQTNWWAIIWLGTGYLELIQLVHRCEEYLFIPEWKCLKGFVFGYEWNLLHGTISNYPQTAGKRTLLMHNNCEEECLLNVFFSSREEKGHAWMKVGQGFLKHAIPCFLGGWCLTLGVV